MERWALSDEGKAAVTERIRVKNWTRVGWAAQASTSTATIKRFIAGVPVEAACFYSLIEALGLDVKESYKRNKIELVNSALIPILECLRLDEIPGIFMTARFTENNRNSIERGLRHLRKFLIAGGEITLTEDKGSVTVCGSFSEDSREHVEQTITQLEKLFLSCHVTW